MSGVPVTVPLQIMCQLMVAGQVIQNLTLPVIPKLSLPEKTESPVLPSGYTAFPEYGVAYKCFDIVGTQNEARKVCLNENAQSAVIDSREKVEKVLNRFTYAHEAWVGIGQFHDTEEWITVDGRSTSNLPWAWRFPVGSERCAYLSRGSNGLVNNSCENRYKILCEIPWPRN